MAEDVTAQDYSTISCTVEKVRAKMKEMVQVVQDLKLPYTRKNITLIPTCTIILKKTPLDVFGFALLVLGLLLFLT